MILQPPLNPIGLPRLGFLAHAFLGKLPAWDGEANLRGGLAQMYSGTGPILWKIWVQVSSSLLSPLKHILINLAKRWSEIIATPWRKKDRQIVIENMRK